MSLFRKNHLLMCCLAVLQFSLCALVYAAGNNKTAAATGGEQLFSQHCMGCHSGFLGSRAPSKQVLAKFPPGSIVHALTVGLMRVQGSPLSGEQRRIIAEYLTGKKLDNNLVLKPQSKCKDNPAMPDPEGEPQWNGWGNGLANASFQSEKNAGINADSVKDLKLKWAFGFADSFSAWSQPVVASNRIFVGSQAGIFYSLSAPTGCAFWQFKTEAGVRGAASIVEFSKQAQIQHKTRFGVLFGDMSGNVYALNAATGKLLWKVRVDAHPKARITGSPTLFEDRYFVPMSSWSTVGEPGEDCCTFRGSLSALDVSTGKILWKTYTIPEEARLLDNVTPQGKPIWGPAGSAIWSPPLVDAKRQLVYAGTGNSYTGAPVNSDSMIAFDMKTGSIRWTRQLTPDDVWVPGCKNDDASRCQVHSGPNFDIASPAMMVSAKQAAGGERDLIVVGQKSGVAYALDPDQKGAIVWQYRVGEGGTGGGIVWGSATLGATVYFPLSDMTSPVPGGLHAVSIETGQARWVAAPGPLLCGSIRYGCNAAQPVGISVIPGVLFAGSVDGGFRAYSSENGSLLWEYDTNKKFQTVNGVAAEGGSLIGSGPTIAGGMVFVNSGYGTNGGRAGNVLLAFSIH
ncbi:PQQ-binding-like beta-propeller repeat protein [Undibacterium sp. TJN19]|uniref:outer membrane protein assembly factor BamB family protein n=1 Tax=Undibacterium sp. TJN19 TaxID=3413055 RepID=UPI003BF0AB26